MEATLWQLRCDCAKLPQDAPDGPYGGCLRLARANIAGEITLHAGLHASRSQGAPPLIQGLTAVEVRRLDDRSLLLYGLQAEPPGDPATVRRLQAWFCQPMNSN